MMCICGFSCGTVAALERHVARAEMQGAASGNATLHGLQDTTALEPGVLAKTWSPSRSPRLLAPLKSEEESPRRRARDPRWQGASSETAGCALADGVLPRVVRTPQGSKQRSMQTLDLGWYDVTRLPEQHGDHTSMSSFPPANADAEVSTYRRGARELLLEVLEEPNSCKRVAPMSSVPRSPSSTLPVRTASPRSQGRPRSRAGGKHADKACEKIPRRMKTIDRPHTVRLLLVRHAHSSNKSLGLGEVASHDPDLTDLGREQAELLGKRLSWEVRKQRNGGVLIVTSPMRRCLLTIMPTIRRLAGHRHTRVCHGSFYEYGAVGTERLGTPAPAIAAEYPEFELTSFGVDGAWDYAGTSPRESEQEARQRGEKIMQWIRQDSFDMLGESGLSGTLVLVIHQTMADMICVALNGDPIEDWHYGDLTFKLQNAAITEVFLKEDGSAQFTFLNDASHLHSIREQRGYVQGGRRRV